MAPWQQLDEHFPWNASSSGFETKPLYLLVPSGKESVQQLCQQRDGSDGARPQGRGQQLQHANYRIVTSLHRTAEPAIKGDADGSACLRQLYCRRAKEKRSPFSSSCSMRFQ
jgi:hypothetical protein